VWSVLGEGSTFTLRLPPYTAGEVVVPAVIEEESTA
jgi:hypothetical protein